jgi:hypothetical protein
MGVDAAPAGLRSRASLTRGTSGLRPPPLGAGARSWLKARTSLDGVRLKHGPGVSTNAAAERALRAPPPEWSAVRRGRRFTWRPPRLASAAPAASRTRRHQEAPRGAPRPLIVRGCIPQTSGRSARENADGCLKFGSGKTESGKRLIPPRRGGWKRSASFRPRRQSRREPEPRIIMLSMML